MGLEELHICWTTNPTNEAMEYQVMCGISERDYLSYINSVG